MPVIMLTKDWSDPIPLQAGDFVQNHSTAIAEITPANPDSDPARLRLPPVVGGFQVDAAVTVRARTTNRLHSEELHIVRGF